MKLRQTAAMGLSTLIFSGNILLPYATATTMALNSQSGSQAEMMQQLTDLQKNTTLLASAQLAGSASTQALQEKAENYDDRQVAHPINRVKSLRKYNPLHWLNQLTYLFIPSQGQVKAIRPTRTAKSILVQKLATPLKPDYQMNAAIAAKPADKTSSKTSSASVSKPADKTSGKMSSASGFKPADKASGKISSAPAAKPAAHAAHQVMSSPVESAVQNQSQPESAASSSEKQATFGAASQSETPKKETYTQINLPQPAQQESQQKPQPPAVAMKPAIPAVAPATKIMGLPTAEETFQMLATTPLDKLAVNAKSMFYNPALDSGTPDVTMRGGNGMKVLKSGISQKVTQVDLTIGKAEVIYLSRPAARVAVSNPDIASAVVISPTQIQLVGKAVGVANLLVWGDMVSPDHTVVDVSVHRDVSVLTNQLQYVDPGIQVIPMAAEDTVILTGEASTREAAQLAIEMAKAFFSKNAAGASANANGPSSQAPGSALPGVSSNVINLIKVKNEPSTKVELVRQKLRDIDPNIVLDVVPGPEGNEKVILTGRVATASIASKALNMASVFYGQPGMKMITTQGGNEPTRLQASASASSGGSSNASSTPASASANMLQGSVMTDATGNVISMLEIAQKPQVRCSIKILEVNKNKLNSLGGTLNAVRGASKFASMSGSQAPAPGRAISQMMDSVTVGGYDGAPGSVWGNAATRGSSGSSGWNPTAQGFAQGFGQQYLNGVTQVFSINNQLAGAIQALQEKSLARTLAEPTMTMMSGEQGSFLAGGEIPVAFLGGNGQISIEYKEYGIRLNLLPSVTDDGKIQMQVAPEISTLDRSVTVQGVPGLLTRRMSTSLLLEAGQSFVLAGLFKQEDAESASGFPGISKLPIIGSFFRNKWKTGANTEMIVVVKPEIIPSTTGVTGNSIQPQAVEKPATQISRIYEAEK